MQYKAKLRGTPLNFYPFDKSIVLPISVGQVYHEGDKFYSTLKRINKIKFSKCSIVIADKLQRYNYQLLNGISIEEAKIESYNRGSAWLEKNEKSLNELSIPYEIIRWEECLNHKDFVASMEKINNIKKTNKEYFKALKDDIKMSII